MVAVAVVYHEHTRYDLSLVFYILSLLPIVHLFFDRALIRTTREVPLEPRTHLLQTTEAMGFLDAVRSQLRPMPTEAEPHDEHNPADAGVEEQNVVEVTDEKHVEEPVETGVSTIEAAQAIWGKTGRWLVIAG